MTIRQITQAIQVRFRMTNYLSKSQRVDEQVNAQPRGQGVWSKFETLEQVRWQIVCRIQLQLPESRDRRQAQRSQARQGVQLQGRQGSQTIQDSLGRSPSRKAGISSRSEAGSLRSEGSPRSEGNARNEGAAVQGMKAMQGMKDQQIKTGNVSSRKKKKKSVMRKRRMLIEKRFVKPSLEQDRSHASLSDNSERNFQWTSTWHNTSLSNNSGQK